MIIDQELRIRILSERKDYEYNRNNNFCDDTIREKISPLMDKTLLYSDIYNDIVTINLQFNLTCLIMDATAKKSIVLSFHLQFSASNSSKNTQFFFSSYIVLQNYVLIVKRLQLSKFLINTY